MAENMIVFYEALQELDNARRSLNDLCAEYHISFEQFVLMKRILVAGGIRPTELSDELHISRPAVSRKLTQLYYSDYLSKERSQTNQDQRIVTIVLTDTGRSVVESLDESYRERLAQITEPVKKVTDTVEIFEVLGEDI
ncbi:MarR family transcriptional regulator [Lactobacillus curvatus]|uniref:transcriptional regulator, SarA/Rot family n=1 Tax=Latilactobacillus fragifolii TaxID=2814244 RepID=UPI0012B02A8B|nr:MarR family transcriptional regulator [Latilactobacillus fragifolii]MSD83812.1 MarR family transcriptional regulator [Latilactobacillus curvatus]MSE24005.1 MarR family transcriptional regulator [Latilactobacillus curvatus]